MNNYSDILNWFEYWKIFTTANMHKARENFFFWKIFDTGMIFFLSRFWWEPYVGMFWTWKLCKTLRIHSLCAHSPYALYPRDLDLAFAHLPTLGDTTIKINKTRLFMTTKTTNRVSLLYIPHSHWNHLSVHFWYSVLQNVCHFSSDIGLFF
jgi:hypothetical protein